MCLGISREFLLHGWWFNWPGDSLGMLWAPREVRKSHGVWEPGFTLVLLGVMKLPVSQEVLVLKLHPQSSQLSFGQLSRLLWLTSHLPRCPALNERPEVSISTCFWKPTLRSLSGQHLDSLRKKQGLPRGPSEQASPSDLTLVLLQQGEKLKTLNSFLCFCLHFTYISGNNAVKHPPSIPKLRASRYKPLSYQSSKCLWDLYLRDT